MRKVLTSLILFLCAAGARAQSTTVSATVTDSGGVTWVSGTYEFDFVGPQIVNWPGGTVTRVVKGSLNGSGAFSQSLPDTNTITPSPVYWNLKVCPIIGVFQGCYIQSNLTITGNTQPLTVTPPALSISGTTNLPLAAYADAEIVAPVPLGFIYYQVTTSSSGVYRQCEQLTATACTTWANVASAGGGTVTGSGVAGQIAVWTTSSNISGFTGFTYNSVTQSFQVTGGASSNSFISAGAGNEVVLINATGVGVQATDSGGTVNIQSDALLSIASNNGNVTIGAGVGKTIAMTSETDLGVTGGGAAGVLGFFGSTSGKCTLTANATGAALTSSCPLTIGTIGGKTGEVDFQGSSSGNPLALRTNNATAGLILNSSPAGTASLQVDFLIEAGLQGTTNGEFALIGSTSGSCTLTVNSTGTSVASSCPITGLTSTTFDQIGSGTNTTAAMLVGAGGSLNFTSTGTINASTLGGATFAAPGPIGSTTASTGAFTTLSASSTVSGTGFSTYLASPPAIGGTARAAGSFSSLACGVINTTACVITGAGSTNGTATFTWPAVAGTAANPVVMSNALIGPAGAAGSPTFVTSTGVGFYAGGTTYAQFTDQSSGSNPTFVFGAAVPGLEVRNGDSFGFSTNTNAAGGRNASLGNPSSGVISADTSTAGNGLGTFTATGYQAAGTAGITSSGILCSGTFSSKAGLVTACTAVSDARLKMNIHPFPYGLKEVVRMQPDTWNFTDEARTLINGLPGDTRVGPLAQDFERIFPEYVSTEEHGGKEYKSIPQIDAVTLAALVNATKQQQQEIESLRREISQLKAHHK